MNKTKRRSQRQRQKRNRNRKSNTKRRMQRAGGIGFSSQKPPEPKPKPEPDSPPPKTIQELRNNPDVSIDRPIDEKALFYWDDNERNYSKKMNDFNDFRISLLENEDDWRKRKRFYFCYNYNNKSEWMTLGTFREFEQGKYTFKDQRENGIERLIWDGDPSIKVSILETVYYLDDVSQVSDQTKPLKRLMGIIKRE